MKKATSAEDRGSPAGPVLAPTSRSPQAATLHHSLWLWVAAGFLFLALLWIGMFVASRQADTRSVPLATPGGRP